MLSVLSGVESAARLHLAEGHPARRLEKRNIVVTMETAQTQSPPARQQQQQRQGLTTISLEEQKVLRSVERLDHRLHGERFVNVVWFTSELIHRSVVVLSFQRRVTSTGLFLFVDLQSNFGTRGAPWYLKKNWPKARQGPQHSSQTARASTLFPCKPDLVSFKKWKCLLEDPLRD